MLDWVRFCLTALLLIGGLSVLTIGVIGVYRFDYVLNRMHAAAMGDTLGLLISMVALVVSAQDVFTALKLLLIVVFLWIASPVSSHLICRLEVATNPNLPVETEACKE